jgi:hypothetical protein
MDHTDHFPELNEEETMRKLNRNLVGLLITLALLIATAGTALAQQRIDETKPASATGLVKIVNIAGSVKITGWDRNEVRVTGTLGEGTERLDFIAEGDETTIEVVLPRRAQDEKQSIKGSDLEIMLPGGSRVDARTISADITAGDITGALDLNTISGKVDVNNTPSRIRAESISGNVDIETCSGSIRANSIAGEVTIGEAVGSFDVGTVSGSIKMKALAVEAGTCASLTGSILLDAVLAAGGSLELESHSGTVELHVPADISATFDVETFSGDINNAFGQEAERKSRYGPGQELHFTTGGGDGSVSINAFSGRVIIRHK